MANEAKNRKEIGNPPVKYGRGQNPNSRRNLEKGMAKPGDVLNPKGKPVGSKDRDAEIRKWTTVESEFSNPITKQKERMTVRDAMTLAMIGAVILEKNVGAFKALNEEEFGKTVQDVNLSGNLTIKTFADLAIEAEREMNGR